MVVVEVVMGLFTTFCFLFYKKRGVYFKNKQYIITLLTYQFYFSYVFCFYSFLLWLVGSFVVSRLESLVFFLVWF